MILELLFELVFQFVVEVLAELGFDLASRTLRSRVGRLVVSGVAGFGGGIAWGAYLASTGHEALPRTVWVSLTLAVAALVASVVVRAHAGGDRPGLALLPWRWTPHQWEGLAVLNAFLAAGVVVGFA